MLKSPKRWANKKFPLSKKCILQPPSHTFPRGSTWYLSGYMPSIRLHRLTRSLTKISCSNPPCYQHFVFKTTPVTKILYKTHLGTNFFILIPFKVPNLLFKPIHVPNFTHFKKFTHPFTNIFKIYPTQLPTSPSGPFQHMHLNVGELHNGILYAFQYKAFLSPEH